MFQHLLHLKLFHVEPLTKVYYGHGQHLLTFYEYAYPNGKQGFPCHRWLMTKSNVTQEVNRISTQLLEIEDLKQKH